MVNGLTLNFFDFQEKAVLNLLDISTDSNSKQTVVMKALTGAGKTIILIGYVDEYLRFLYKGIIINHNKKPSQPTLKRRFFKKKAAFFHGPVWERSGADFILKRKGEFF